MKAAAARGFGPGFAGPGEPTMKRHIRRVAMAGAIVAALAAAGCATVQPWQRGRLADPCMQFDRDGNKVAFDSHWQSAREGSIGGAGLQGGGCGCR
jgi:hypothetical protein